MLSNRELALVLAALRYWQESCANRLVSDALLEIATDSGKLEVLSRDEIDRLCERLNATSNAAARYVLYDFDADELATTLVYHSLDSAKQDADQLDNVVILKLPRTGQDEDSICECQEPGGYFYSGVPGILAHLEADTVATGTEVERCDQCQRYPSDAAALAKLKKLGLA